MESPKCDGTQMDVVSSSRRRPDVDAPLPSRIVLTRVGIDQRLRTTTSSSPLRQEAATLARAVGAEVARRREACGLTQTELALAVGCDRSAVSRWEGGRRLPTLPHLAALARALGCCARALLPED